MSNTKDVLDTILDRLRNLASTETVIGEPVQLGEVTILPVIKISIGFGAGGGEGTKSSDQTTAGGSGGGGGASVQPVGFVVWDGTEVKFVGIGKHKIEALLESVPGLMKKFGISMKGKQGKDTDVDEDDV